MSAWCFVRLRPGFHLNNEEASRTSGKGYADASHQLFVAGIYDGSIITFKMSQSGELEKIQQITQPQATTYCICELDHDSMDGKGNYQSQTGPLVAACCWEPVLRVESSE